MSATRAKKTSYHVQREAIFQHVFRQVQNASKRLSNELAQVHEQVKASVECIESEKPFS